LLSTAKTAKTPCFPGCFSGSSAVESTAFANRNDLRCSLSNQLCAITAYLEEQILVSFCRRLAEFRQETWYQRRVGKTKFSSQRWRPESMHRVFLGTACVVVAFAVGCQPKAAPAPQTAAPAAATAHSEKEFKDTTLQIDGVTFVNCTFSKVKLEFSGGRPPKFVDCTFDNDCKWTLGATDKPLPAEVVRSWSTESVKSLMTEETPAAEESAPPAEEKNAGTEPTPSAG